MAAMRNIVRSCNVFERRRIYPHVISSS